MLLALGCTPVRAGLHVEIEGVRLAVDMRGEEPYVSLGAFAAARFLEYEYSYIEDTYMLRNPHAGARFSTLRFRPGDREAIADGVRRPLRSPPLEGADGLLVPLRDFAALALPPEQAAGLRVRPDDGPAARLLRIVPHRPSGYTKIVFDFAGLPEARIQDYPQRLEVELLFEGARIDPRSPREFDIDSPEVARVVLSERPDLLQVRVAIMLRSRARAHGFPLTASDQYVLMVEPDRSAGALTHELPEAVTERERLFFAAQSVGIDPGHGGTDRGARSGEKDEKAFALQVARELTELLTDTGLPAELVRADDRLVPMHARIHHLNRSRHSAVLSLHARAGQPVDATTAPMLFVLPAARAEPTTSVGVLDVRGLLAPRASEVAASHDLAASLVQSCRAHLDAEVPVIHDPSLLPVARTLAPSLLIDLGPLEHFRKVGEGGDIADPARRRLVFALYQGVLDHFRRLHRTLGEAARREASRVPGPEIGLEGYRRNVLSSPSYTEPDEGPTPFSPGGTR